MSAENKNISLCEMEEIDARNNPVEMFHCDGCDCDVVKDSREHDECLCDKNGENWVCGDCYQGEYDKECAHCGEFCPDEYEGDIDGDEEPLCEDCFEQMEKCEMCGDPTDAEPWSDIQEDVLYCSHCCNKHQMRIAECEAIVKSSSSREEALVKWENLKLERAVAKAEAIDKKVEAIREAEEKEICIRCKDICSDYYRAYRGEDEGFVCDKCVDIYGVCEECAYSTDAEPWKDVEGEVLHCFHCKDKRMREIAEAIAQIMPIMAKAEAIAEEIEIIKRLKAEVEEPKPFQMFQSIIAEAVAKQEAEPEPDEEFEAEVSNSHLLEVFGGEVVYNKVKELLKYPDLSSTLRVVWKFGKEHLSLYVYIEGEPFLDAVYPRNHSCDMFYMLEELKKEQECEVNGVCWECEVEGKFIGKEGDDWRCSECSSI